MPVKIPEVWHIYGSIKKSDGTPFTQGKPQAFDFYNNQEYYLGETGLDAKGNFTITYSRSQFQRGDLTREKPEVILKVIDWQNKCIWRSPILNDVTPEYTYNIVLSDGGPSPIEKDYYMADLGDLLGSLMTGLLRARRVADEQTAALAEYYKVNPLLEGLTIPRIRIPELTIDMPLLIEGQTEGVAGIVSDPKKIAAAAKEQLLSLMSTSKVKFGTNFEKIFTDNVVDKVSALIKSNIPAMKETVERSVQDAFIEALSQSDTSISASDRDKFLKSIRETISLICLEKEPIAPKIEANIKTADVKDRAAAANVVRLKITMKEEGLEWSVQSSEAGGTKRSLQVE